MALKERPVVESWQAEGDLRTLIEAEKIEMDKKRMAAVRELAKKQLAQIAVFASSEGEKD